MARLIQSLPIRLMLAAAVLLAVPALVTYAAISWQANRLLAERAQSAIANEAGELRRAYEAGGAGALAAGVAELSRRTGPGLYLLRDARGSRLAGNIAVWPAEVDPNRGGAVFHYAGDAAASRLAVANTVTTPDGLSLLIGRDIEDQRRLAAGMQQTALAGMAGMAGLALAAGFFARRRFLGRIDAITATSKSIMAGNLAERIPLANSGDELDRLAGSLNAMLARIEALLASLREVSDNIAHDLRTPLTRLRNRADAALRDPAGAPAYRDGLEKTLEEADGLMRTFNALLLIARVEAGAVAESMQPTDLAQIVHDVVELYQPLAEEAGLAMAVTAPDGLVIDANRELLGQALLNLVDNAIKYSGRYLRPPSAGADPGPISVTVVSTPGGVEIAVGDHGPGIAPEDRERALKRFVRLEKSRTRPGSGLGLSLVAAVARMHRGRLRLEDNAPGLKVVLELPRSSTLR